MSFFLAVICTVVFVGFVVVMVFAKPPNANGSRSFVGEILLSIALTATVVVGYAMGNRLLVLAPFIYVGVAALYTCFGRWIVSRQKRTKPAEKREGG
jgi:hypothetical protein